MYSIQYKRGESSFRLFAMSDVHMVPNRSQKLMLDAVTEGLLQGICYTSDMYKFVVDKLKDELNDEILSRGADHVENGHFGMDIYYARNVAKKNLTKIANQKAMEKLLASGMLYEGVALKKFQYGAKQFSTATVNEIKHKAGLIHFTGKVRGSAKRWLFTLGANDTRLLIALTEGVEDRDLIVQKDEHGSRYIINMGANRRAELECQI